MTIGNGRDPEHDPDFSGSFPSFGDEPSFPEQGSHTHANAGHGHGPDDGMAIDFDGFGGSMPEPPAGEMHEHAPGEDADPFHDIGSGGEEGFGTDGADTTYEGDPEAEEATENKQSLLSKLIIPVGTAIIIGVAGAGAYFLGFFGGTSTPVQQQAAVPVQRPVAAAQQPPAVPLTLPARSVPVPATTAAVPAAIPTLTVVPTPASLPASLTDTRQGDPRQQSDIEKQLASLIEATNKVSSTLGDKFATFDHKVSDLGDTVSKRLDQADGRASSLATREAAVESRLEQLERRLEEGVKASGTPSRLQASATPQAVPAAQKPGKAEARRDSPTDVAAQARPGARITGFSLHGVGQGDNPKTAWIQTPGGYLLVSVGQAVSGAGTVREVRRSDVGWEVVTTNGVIRP